MEIKTSAYCFCLSLESPLFTTVILIKSEKFHLPSKKRLIEDTSVEIIVVDTTEIEIERPQKNRKNTIRVRKKDTQ